MFGLPVTVKIERPEERAARLEEEAKRERIRAQEEKEEKERKERLEKKAKEEEEKKAKDVAEKVSIRILVYNFLACNSYTCAD